MIRVTFKSTPVAITLIASNLKLGESCTFIRHFPELLYTRIILDDYYTPKDGASFICQNTSRVVKIPSDEPVKIVYPTLELLIQPEEKEQK